MRGVTPDEAECLGLDERRQLDELLRAAQEVPSVEVPTDPPREPEEPSRDDPVGMEAVEPMTLLEEARETESSTEIGEQSSAWRKHGENLGQQNWTILSSRELVWRHTLRTNRRKLGRMKPNKSVPWVPTRIKLADGLTKSSAGVFLRNALTSGTAQLHEESTKALKKKQIVSSSKEVQGASVEPLDLELQDWWR